MKKRMIISAFLILIMPAAALANAMSFRLGYFIPSFKGLSDSLWNIEFDQMTFTKANYQNATFGLAYEQFLTRELSLVIGVEGYSRSKTGSYKDYVGYDFEEGSFAFPAKHYQGDYSIDHAFNVSITPIQFSLKIMPTGRRGPIVPYIGGGIGVYFWSAKILGYTVDFSDAYVYEDPDLGDVDVYSIRETEVRDDNRISFGGHVFGGLMIPVSNRIAIEAEVKYNFVKGNLDAFKDMEKFDVGGYQLSIGVNYWF